MSIAVALLPFRCFYDPAYNLPLGDHVFPARKFAGLREVLAERHLLDETNVRPAPQATRLQVARVHTPAWTAALLDGTIRYDEVLRLEIPYSRPLVDGFLHHAGGSIAAAAAALEDGGAFNLGGGFHHAFPGHGEGFCALHDVAIAIRELQAAGRIRRAIVIDTDVHQGNGTAAIFAGDETVFTFSIHQENNYPAEKPPSDLDIGLDDGAGDEPYLEALAQGIEECFERCDPDLVAYVAGSDPYCQDKLGGLNLSIDGMYMRDTLVAEAARRRSLPVFVTLAGGYATNFNDTLTLHANTALALAAAMTR